MDESSAMRAIMIGASVFVAIATITAVLTYYNTSKDLVQSIGTGTNFGEEYSSYVENVLLKTEGNSYITGTDVKNLLNYFYKADKAEINISSVIPLYSDTDEDLSSTTLSGNNVNHDEDLYVLLSSKIVSNQKFKINKSNENGKLIINIDGIK